jgi:hypothetical protein
MVFYPSAFHRQENKKLRYYRLHRQPDADGRLEHRLHLFQLRLLDLADRLLRRLDDLG